jgi:hypothetical protein
LWRQIPVLKNALGLRRGVIPALFTVLVDINQLPIWAISDPGFAI